MEGAGEDRAVIRGGVTRHDLARSLWIRDSVTTFLAVHCSLSQGRRIRLAVAALSGHIFC